MTGADGGGRTDTAGVRCRIDTDGDGRFAWRMVAQNGRVVAVSPGAFGTYSDCRDAFEELRTGFEEQAGAVQHTAAGNGWVWLLRRADGRSTAVSARAYERHSTCLAAYERFRKLLGRVGEDTGSCL
ncbi:hypothetical protein AB0D35_08100 [Streptomyces sp. NPDC048301]|uniref:hypothetical protein n=1 Tax=unclassified Streptomyces TaxID=2593676 RepID=UPI00342F607A